MRPMGKWTGNFLYDGLNEYVENEFFQIEFLPTDIDGGIAAIVSEEVPNAELFPSKTIKSYLATGSECPFDGKIQLFYESQDFMGEVQLVELLFLVNKEKRIIEGTYKAASKEQKEVKVEFRLVYSL